MERANALAGHTLGELACALGLAVPASLRRHKGWVGQLIETCLGAMATNRPVPDFENLGIELKTLPVDRFGQPRETTYLCTVDLSEVEELQWESSRARKKLARVLFIPILAEPDIDLGARMVGSPILWSPNDAQEQALRRDWQEHMDLIAQGLVETITARDGRYLQIRPKAANAHVMTWGVDDRGDAVMTTPRGFYLRTSFTGELLRAHFGLI
ncbi:MAG: DNA mismatch repair endonuclease MutH [Bradymonadaceae bacterium]|nr:DNA mismatch repair endonuclease MutH [Lujinxingiaceae bacterium]